MCTPWYTLSVKASLTSESGQGSDLAPFFYGDRSQSEKPPEIKLPLNMLETERTILFISNFFGFQTVES